MKKVDERYCKSKMTQVTPLKDVKSTSTLSSHDIKCEVGYILKSFHMNFYDPGVNFEYQCCPAKTSDCKTNKTAETNEGENGVLELNNQIVKVNDEKNEALTGFKLVAINQKFSYEVNFCKVTG